MTDDIPPVDDEDNDAALPEPEVGQSEDVENDEAPE